MMLQQGVKSPEIQIGEEKRERDMRGNLDGFKCDRLFRFLNLLDRDIEIIIRPHTDPEREAGIRVC